MLRKSPLSETVQVLVRCRPMSVTEENERYANVVEVDSSRGTIMINNLKLDSNESVKTFTFDAVFDESSSQEDVYETVRPLVSSVLSGFNGTIFAYGQTGTGKTHTMEGSLVDPEQKGIIQRSFDQIFSHISRSENQQFLVTASYLEIYQEEIRDLLNKKSIKCEIREGSDHGMHIKGLSTFVCKTATDISDVMARGNACRSIGTTNMNEHSSRSHAILTITIEMIDLTLSDGDQKCIRVGKLNLVDLAGSERQGKSHARGHRLKEAAMINLSLSALGNVIFALSTKGTQPHHIPYRDSKLTRLLQDSLGGNANTVMVANIGPASFNYEETLTTLRFADRAKSIKNKAVINEDPKDAQLRQYRDEITRLRAQIAERQEQSVVIDTLMEDLTHAVCEKSSKKSNKIILQNNNEDLDQMRSRLADDEKLVSDLEAKIKMFESKVLRGDKNIIDHTNEQQRALEQQRQEIVEKKRLEVLMRQRLEQQEYTVLDLQSSYSNLHQEVDIKTKKLKKVFSKFQNVKQEIQDVGEEYNRDRRELELTQNEMLKELKAKSMIIDNFIPMDFKKRLMNELKYSDELDDWAVKWNSPEYPADILKRPVTVPGRRPMSDYSRAAQLIVPQHKYQMENLLEQTMERSCRSTLDYEPPAIAPDIQAVLEQALKTEKDLVIDAAYVTFNERTTVQRAMHASEANRYRFKYYPRVYNWPLSQPIPSTSAYSSDSTPSTSFVPPLVDEHSQIYLIKHYHNIISCPSLSTSGCTSDSTPSTSFLPPLVDKRRQMYMMKHYRKLVKRLLSHPIPSTSGSTSDSTPSTSFLPPLVDKCRQMVSQPIPSSSTPSTSFLPPLVDKGTQIAKPSRRKSAVPASKQVISVPGGVKSARGTLGSLTASHQLTDGPVYPKARGLVPKK